MARLLWFAVGAAAGLAYASQLINKERLNLAPTDAEIAMREAQMEAEAQAPKQDFKVKLADTIDQQTDRLLLLVDERVTMLTEKLHETGHQLAAKLRGEPKEIDLMAMPGTVMIYGEAFTTPFEDLPSDQSDTGFEANR
jgi:hypothetical protein